MHMQAVRHVRASGEEQSTGPWGVRGVGVGAGVAGWGPLPVSQGAAKRVWSWVIPVG